MMKKLVNLIKEQRFVEAENEIDSIVPLIMEKKIFEMKKAVAAKMSEQMGFKPAAEKLRAGITEDEIEESIDPTEIHNGPAPKGQRVNSADKGDKQPANTTVVPKNNIKEEEIEEMSNLKDADNLQIKNMQKSFGKDGAIKRIMSPVNRDPKFTKDQSKSPQNSFGVSDDKQNRGLAPSTSDIPGNAKDFLRRSTPSSEIVNEEKLEEARVSIIKARVRGGKIQRRKKVSNVPGMTLRGGTLKRMSAAERRRRKMGARKGKLKRKAKLSRSLMKRKRSLQKRKSLGL